MADRPYVLLSAAMSVDGYLDDSTHQRLILSSDADLDRVDEVRANADAILVGATTIRRDNPWLRVRSAARREARQARGELADPVRVTITRSGDLDPAARFFARSAPSETVLVYVPDSAAGEAAARLAGAASVLEAGDPLSLPLVLADLAGRGVRRLLVEGGGTVHTQFLQAGLADELHLVVAPVFVGDPTAPRLVGPGRYPHDAAHRMHLESTEQLGDVALLRYRLAARGTSGPG
ncbi:MAG TPA: dihydrofolate reductase family protein [Streptosporangiaceae bacterium]